MKKYKFTTKNSDESISTCLADNYDTAVETFAAMKKLKREDFLQIYVVKEVS